MLSIVLDVLFIVFIFWFALTGLRQGFIGMLGRLLSAFAALILAFIFNGPLLDLLYSLPWFNGFQARLGSSLLKLFDSTASTVPQAVAASALPSTWQRGLIGQGNGSAAPGNNAADSPLALLSDELAGRIMAALVFFLLFMILLFLIRLILQLVSNVVNQLPVIGAFNRFAGFFAGIAYGMLIIAIALLVVTLTVPWLPEAAQAVSETALLSHFYNNNPLLLVF
ncbi:MAG: CvpA family protein [Saccharofermentanales bacterium]|jgi:uncharacterized membrane protein required for colicin V production